MVTIQSWAFATAHSCANPEEEGLGREGDYDLWFL